MTDLSRRSLMIGATVASAGLIGAAGAGTAQADASWSRSGGDASADTAAGSSANSGIPATVDASTDLASQGPGGASDSIYFTSHVRAPGHTFGILVHTVNAAEHDQRIVAISVTDQTSGWYKSYQVPVAAEDYSWSTESLDIKMPALTWTGDLQTMAVKATTPWGSLELTLEKTGPVMNYAGTGEFDMLGERQWEFAIPSMRTTGTLTVDGTTYRVAGESWVDRQWGELPLNATNRWSWMNMSLSNGDKVAIWDFVGADRENCWATVQHPDGSYELVAVNPLADNASDVWTSPTSGNKYPTRWRVQIPALQADLDVQITGPKEQELVLGALVRLEGTASASGTYQGQRVTGHNYVEMVGNWSN